MDDGFIMGVRIPPSLQRVMCDSAAIVQGLFAAAWVRVESRLAASIRWRGLAASLAVAVHADDARPARVGFLTAGAIVLLAVGVWAYQHWSGGGELERLETPLMCLNCGKLVFAELEPGRERPPCPACDRPTLAPACACSACGTYLVLNEYRGTTDPSRCPRCRREVRHGE
jgi:hypothetical protein